MEKSFIGGPWRGTKCWIWRAGPGPYTCWTLPALPVHRWTWKSRERCQVLLLVAAGLPPRAAFEPCRKTSKAVLAESTTQKHGSKPVNPI